MSRHTEPLTRILNLYTPGYPLLQALEAYIASAEQQVVNATKADAAKSVCEGLHAGPPAGIRCVSCIEALANVNSLMAVEAEIENSKRKEE